MSRVEEALRQLAPEAREQSPDQAKRKLFDNELEGYPAERVQTSVLDSISASHVPAAVPKEPTGGRLATFDPVVRDKLIVSKNVMPATVEQYRRLAATLHEAQADRGLKILMVSSALPHDGKTLTAINLALTLSESYNQRVLLVDADLRRPSVHAVLRLSNRAGLSEWLRAPHGPPPFLEVSPHLSVLLAGRADANPLAGLTSGRMKDLLADAAHTFDWVLVDTPPLGLLPDAQLVGRLADAVLLVINARSTPYQLVQRAVADVGEERVIGVVLNRADVATTIHDYYGSYYIGSAAQGQGQTDG